MSLMIRPFGDSIEKIYGKYMSIGEIKSTISIGKRYEVLCDDGLNYIVEVKAFNQDNFHGSLHFTGWSSKRDFTGDISKLYVTAEGNFSKGLLSSSNKYTFEGDMVKPMSMASTKAKRSTGESIGSVSALEQRTRYPDDFLKKPRKKRRRSDNSQLKDNESGTSSAGEGPSSSSAGYSSSAQKESGSGAAPALAASFVEPCPLNSTAVVPSAVQMQDISPNDNGSGSKESVDETSKNCGFLEVNHVSNISKSRALESLKQKSKVLNEENYFSCNEQPNNVASSTSASFSSTASRAPPVQSLAPQVPLFASSDIANRTSGEMLINTLRCHDSVEYARHALELLETLPDSFATQLGVQKSDIIKLIQARNHLDEALQLMLRPQ